jgi:anti-sigma regulatory factor (Ser/Thr protein kinase)
MQKYLDEDIIIHTGVKHLNVPEDKLAKTKDEAIKEAVTNTARHIYKNRINNILPK